ncbi:cilia- and flagella-associated protein 298-B [Amblyomma americanum]
MVKLKVQCGNAVQFLVETSLSTTLDALIQDVTDIYSDVLVIRLAAANIESFARRLEKQPNAPKVTASTLAEPSVILAKVTAEALARVSNTQLESGKTVTKSLTENTKDMLKTTLSTLDLPKAMEGERNVLLVNMDKMDVENSLSGDDAKLWWAGKELCRGNELRKYFGSNEKTTVTVALSSQPPERSKSVAEAQFNEFLLSRMKRQKDLEELEPDEETQMHDRYSLRKYVHGLEDVKWKP